MKMNLNLSMRKSLYECYYSFARVDYDAIQENTFQPLCHTNVNRINIFYNEYCNSNVDQFLSRITRHRQSSKFTANTPNLLKRLQIQREPYKAKPTLYRKQKLLKLKKTLSKDTERDKPGSVIFETYCNLHVQTFKVYELNCDHIR